MHDLEGLFYKTVVSGINDKIAKKKKRRRLKLVGTGSSPWASAQVSEEARQRWGWPYRGAAQLVERPRRPAGWKRPRRKVNGSEAGSRRPLELDAEHDAAVAAGVLGRDGSTRAAPAGILRIERS